MREINSIKLWISPDVYLFTSSLTTSELSINTNATTKPSNNHKALKSDHFSVSDQVTDPHLK